MAIDGKTLRHSYDKGNKKAAIHRVSARASQNRLVLAQVKVEKKSNEITAIPQQTIDGRHGRIEIRRHWLLDGVEHLMDAGLWSGLKRVGMVESERLQIELDLSVAWIAHIKSV